MKKKFSAFLAIMMCSTIIFSTGCSQESSSSASSEKTTNATSATEEIDEKEIDLKYPEYKEYNLDTTAPIKNIIVMIGDGMGANHIKAAEIQKGDKLNMEGMKYQGYVKTSSLDGITDSAAAATAISCGVKANNGKIAVDKDNNEVENLFEFAKKNNMKTGFAVTEFLPHATPAAFSSHAESRNSYREILNQQIDNQINVMLGSGQKFYGSKTRERMEENNYTYVSSLEEMNAFNKNTNLIGMFKYEVILAGYHPSLTQMTTKALDVLTNDDGFCLLVEGSDIDTRAAIPNMDAMLREMNSFDNAVDAVLQYAEKNPGTLVIITADHETGGLEFPEGTKAEDLNNDMFTSGGEHTDANVRIFADGAQADKFLTSEVIDNTDIAKQIRALYTNSKAESSTEKEADTTSAA